MARRLAAVSALLVGLSGLGCNVIQRADVVDANDAGPADLGVDTNFTVPDVGFPDIVARDAAARDAQGTPFCNQAQMVPGAIVPSGFCISPFARADMLREPRNLAFAPNGDLFVSAPSNSTGAGVSDGPGAIIVLADDNHDGMAELYTFASIPDVHGIAFAADGLYFTTTAGVFRTAYTAGQRAETTASRVLIAPFGGTAPRWTHGLGITPAGTIYATTGVWGATCPDPNAGFIDRVMSASGSMAHQLTGFRNPMFIRCHPYDEVCVITELGEDGGGTYGAHEKLLAIRSSGNYGYPCCAGLDEPATGIAASMCMSTAEEEVAFPLNSTPFGMDWEPGNWRSPYNGALFLAFHGSYYSSIRYEGTRIVFATTDPVTHLPNSPFEDFVTGFAAGGTLSRATSVAFAPDGRMFFADDTGGGVYWVAPTDLRSL